MDHTKMEIIKNETNLENSAISEIEKQKVVIGVFGGKFFLLFFFKF
jgi:hypothetical protein